MSLLLDLSHTSHTRARTGIQRVARALHRTLGDRCVSVCFDPYQDLWRPLESWEERNLASADPAKGRGSHWPLSARLRGHMRQLAGRPPPPFRGGAGDSGTGPGVIVPEIFSAAVAGALPRLFSATKGPRIALFHDAIALQYPEFTPRSTSARFPGYLRDLLKFDGVAAVSEASRRCLLDYWEWLGVKVPPPVAAIPLGIDMPAMPHESPAPGGVPIVLCVGSVEGRKNHAALLDACETLWAKGLLFELRLIGLANAETGASALERLERLRSAGRPVHFDGPKNDTDLEEAYRRCAFTVYPSIAEGFGLPVAESLSRGKPCLCRTEGALGEIASGGGCVSLGAGGAPEIADAIEGLLSSPYEIALLDAAARARRFKSWDQYAAELLGWMGTLSRDA